MSGHNHHDHEHEHNHEHCDCHEHEHDHNHEHDHEHDHSHDHEHHDHNHDHDHDHDHDHEHEHDHEHCDCHEHNHSHDHHDHHDHDHNHDHEIRDGVKIERHEGALICSVAFEAPGDYDSVSSRLAKEMSRLADEIDAAGDLVGHIKAYISGDRRGAMLSTTGGDVSIRDSAPNSVTVNLVAIAFVAQEDAFIAKVAAIRTLLGGKSA